MIKTRIASFALAASLLGGVAMGTVAGQEQGGRQAAGAAGVVAAVVQAVANVNVQDTEIELEVVDIGNSLNNLRALNNVLNNNDVDVVVQDVSVLDAAQLEVLNNANITDVVGVAVLSGGDFIVFTS